MVKRKGLLSSKPILQVFSGGCRAGITMENLILRSSFTLLSPARATLSQIPPKEIAYFYSTRIRCSVLRTHLESPASIFTPPLKQFTNKMRKKSTRSMASTSRQKVTQNWLLLFSRISSSRLYLMERLLKRFEPRCWKKMILSLIGIEP